MKVKRKGASPSGFEPITLEITIETPREFIALADFGASGATEDMEDIGDSRLGVISDFACAIDDALDGDYDELPYSIFDNIDELEA